MHGRTWGDSLDRQGMGEVAGWAANLGLPAITGFIVSSERRQPADGFFRFYQKDPDLDGRWWLEELTKAKTFDWAADSQQSRNPWFVPISLGPAPRLTPPHE